MRWCSPVGRSFLGRPAAPASAASKFTQHFCLTGTGITHTTGFLYLPAIGAVWNHGAGPDDIYWRPVPIDAAGIPNPNPDVLALKKLQYELHATRTTTVGSQELVWRVRRVGAGGSGSEVLDSLSWSAGDGTLKTTSGLLSPDLQFGVGTALFQSFHVNGSGDTMNITRLNVSYEFEYL